MMYCRIWYRATTFISHNFAGENSNAFVTSLGQNRLLIKQVMRNGSARRLSVRQAS